MSPSKLYLDVVNDPKWSELITRMGNRKYLCPVIMGDGSVYILKVDRLEGGMGISHKTTKEQVIKWLEEWVNK